ncbi:glycosyltransferase family 39 protein [Patescibacteria group bacterium]|nr:glycosyltransferase family 39 protein [Patescibacteria group bacterium]
MTKLRYYIPKIILLLIMISAFLLMIGPAKQDSAIMDEPVHISAGYSYIKFLDYRLNPEHPPLIKALSAIPLLFQSFNQQINFPLDSDSWKNQVNGQWGVGNQFLYNSDNDADKIIFYSRIIPMLLMLILIGFTYFWANKLMGKWWALIPAMLIAFSPNFLAHGHYVTTDIGATLGFLTTSYFFLKSIYKPTRKNIIIAGIILGLALLSKFSVVLLLPLFALITAIVFLEKIIKEFNNPIVESKLKKIFKYFIYDFGRLFLIFLIGILIVYSFYFAFTLNYPIEKQYSDTGIILQSLDNRYIADSVIAMSKNEIFRPFSQYILGLLMTIQRSTSDNINYFLGQISKTGNWNYFPIVFLMKETLSSIIIIFLAIILSFYGILKTSFKGLKAIKDEFLEYFATNFSELCMLIFIIIYWLCSMYSSLNIGIRHIFPTIPFIYILSIQAIKKWFYIAPENIANGLAEKFSNAIKKIFNLIVKFSFLSILLIWLVIGTMLSHPYYLSKFNEGFGGTYDGYKYVVDSNFDWGQDLKRLKNWMNDFSINQNGQIESIAIDYFGGGDPNYYLGEKAIKWNSADGNPIENDIEWIAISVNNIQNAITKINQNFDHRPQDEYLWLKNPLSPDYKVGTSIFIYKLNN